MSFFSKGPLKAMVNLNSQGPFPKKEKNPQKADVNPGMITTSEVEKTRREFLEGPCDLRAGLRVKRPDLLIPEKDI